MNNPDSFPCIICGKALERVVDHAEAQPAEGIMCATSGNYGSVVWDSMDGEYLCFNICDDCITLAGEQGRVMVQRRWRPILTDTGFQLPCVVGREMLDRPYVPWKASLRHDDDAVELELDELRSLPAHCELSVTVEEIEAMLRSRQ